MDILIVDAIRAKPDRLARMLPAEQPPSLWTRAAETLLTRGARLALEVRPFDQKGTGLARAARMAGISRCKKVDQLGASKVPLVCYSPRETEQETPGVERLAGRG